MNAPPATVDSIQLIDVLWFQKGTNNVIGAVEVEKSTSIYSGILCLTGQVLSICDVDEVFSLIIPDKRERDVLMQLSRPSLRARKIEMRYILFSDLRTNCDALCRFGDNHRVLEKIAKGVVGSGAAPTIDNERTGSVEDSV